MIFNSSLVPDFISGLVVNFTEMPKKRAIWILFVAKRKSSYGSLGLSGS